MRYSKKYPDDMVENLAESPGMCSNGLGSAPTEIPKRDAFSLRGSKKERKEMTSCGLGRKTEATGLSLHVLGPTSARHTRTVRYSLQNIQNCPSPPRATQTVRVALAYGPPGADGQSGPPPWTVRLSFSFQLDIF
jgi:hypothetical protein